MSDERYKVSGELFKRILTHMDSLPRKQLMELQAEGRGVEPDICSPAFYHSSASPGRPREGRACKP